MGTDELVFKKTVLPAPVAEGVGVSRVMRSWSDRSNCRAAAYHLQHASRAVCPNEKGVCLKLVLSRKGDQEILIGNDITIIIVRVDGNRVRIGIRAPDMSPSAEPK